jgi:hypothetical protein
LFSLSDALEALFSALGAIFSATDAHHPQVRRLGLLVLILVKSCGVYIMISKRKM